MCTGSCLSSPPSGSRLQGPALGQDGGPVRGVFYSGVGRQQHHGVSFGSVSSEGQRKQYRSPRTGAGVRARRSRQELRARLGYQWDKRLQIRWKHSESKIHTGGGKAGCSEGVGDPSRHLGSRASPPQWARVLNGLGQAGVGIGGIGPTARRSRSSSKPQLFSFLCNPSLLSLPDPVNGRFLAIPSPALSSRPDQSSA